MHGAETASALIPNGICGNRAHSSPKEKREKREKRKLRLSGGSGRPGL